MSGPRSRGCRRTAGCRGSSAGGRAITACRSGGRACSWRRRSGFISTSRSLLTAICASPFSSLTLPIRQERGARCATPVSSLCRPSVQLALAEPPAKLSARKGVYILSNKIGKAERHLASAAWKLPATAAAYQAFVTQFAPLDAASERNNLSPQDALVARTLLIHAWRRIVLARSRIARRVLLPDDWPGHAARALTGRIYRRLLGALGELSRRPCQQRRRALAGARRRLVAAIFQLNQRICAGSG